MPRLYKFEGGGDVLAVNGGITVIEFESIEYLPTPINSGSIVYTQETNRSDFSVDVPAVSAVADFVKGKIEDFEIVLTVYDDEKQVFNGDVKAINYSGRRCEIVAAPIFKRIDRKLNRYNYQSRCQHSLFDGGCSLLKSDFETVRTISGISSRGDVITINSALPLDVKFYIGGSVEIGGRRRSIISVENDTDIFLSRPVNAVFGQEIKVHPGCDKTIKTCADFYSNSENYLGFPYKPLFSPFESGTGMFLQFPDLGRIGNSLYSILPRSFRALARRAGRISELLGTPVYYNDMTTDAQSGGQKERKLQVLFGTCVVDNPYIHWWESDGMRTQDYSREATKKFPTRQEHFNAHVIYCLGHVDAVLNAVKFKEIWFRVGLGPDLWQSGRTVDEIESIALSNIFAGSRNIGVKVPPDSSDEWLGSRFAAVGFANGNSYPAMTQFLQDKTGGTAAGIEIEYKNIFHGLWALCSFGANLPHELPAVVLSRTQTAFDGAPMWHTAGAEVPAWINRRDSGGNIFLDTDNIFLQLNPVHVLRECLTVPWSSARVTVDKIDEQSFIDAADYLKNEGIGVSFLLSLDTDLRRIVETLQVVMGGMIYEGRDGKYKIALYRDDYNVDFLPVLHESDIVEVESMARPSIADTPNKLKLSWQDPRTGKTEQVQISDDSDQGEFERPSAEYSLDMVKNGIVAEKIAVRLFRRVARPLYRGVVTADISGVDIDVGSLIVLDAPSRGVDSAVFRVLEIDAGTETRSAARLVLEQDSADLPVRSIEPFPPLWESPYSPPEAVDLQDTIANEAPAFMLIENGEAVQDPVQNNVFYPFVLGKKPTQDVVQADVFVDAAAGFQLSGTTGLSEVYELDVSTGAPSKLIKLTEDANIPAGTRLYIGTSDAGEFAEVITGLGDLYYVKRGIFDSVPIQHLAGTKVYTVQQSGALSERIFTAFQADVFTKILPKTQLGALPIELAPAVPVFFTNKNRVSAPLCPADIRVDGEHIPLSASDDFLITFSHRPRTFTQRTLDFYETTALQADPNVVVRVKCFDSSDNLIFEKTTTGNYIQVLSSDFPGSEFTGQIKIEVDSFNTALSLASYYKMVYIFDYITPSVDFVLTESGDNLLTEGGGNVRAE